VSSIGARSGRVHPARCAPRDPSRQRDDGDEEGDESRYSRRLWIKWLLRKRCETKEINLGNISVKPWK
jgi:hypothetical protein